MNKLLTILTLSFLLAGELEVEGDLKVTGTIENDLLQQEIAQLNATIADLQAQINFLSMQLGYTDCNGVIGGDAIIDCAGVCEGNSQYDSCGVCDNDIENDCIDYMLSFDGDDYVDVGVTPTLSFSGNLSVSAWVRISSFSNIIAAVISKTSNSSPNGFGLELTSNQPKLSFWLADGNDNEQVTTDILSLDTWYHIVGTNDGEHSRIYVNGILQNSIEQGDVGLTDSNPLKLGLHANLDEQDRYWLGDLDEIAVWNDTLTDIEILDLYNSGLGKDASIDYGNYTSSSDLKGYWKFNEGNGNTLHDFSGNENHGQIYGATFQVSP